MDYTDKSYEEIVDIVEKMLVIGTDDLDEEAKKAQKIFTDLNRIYIQFSRKLYKLINQQDKIEMKRNRYYAGKASAAEYKAEPLHEAILKTDIPHYMNIDPLVVEMRTLVKECEHIVKFLEDSKGSLRSRSYDLRAAIDFRKLMMGV